jgi:di/tricarboxylate transporter
MSSVLGDLPHWASVLIMCSCTAFFTEFASNTATANIIVPMLITAGKVLCLNPLSIGKYYIALKIKIYATLLIFFLQLFRLF